MEVLARIVQRKPYKLIADELDISETRVKQHVRTIKQRLSANSIPELVAHFHAQLSTGQREPTPFPLGIEPKREVSPFPALPPTMAADDPGALHLADSMTMDLRAPWFTAEEPQVVPRVLDGDSAALSRLLVIVGIVLGLLAAIVLALTTASTMSAQLQGSTLSVREKTG